MKNGIKYVGLFAVGLWMAAVVYPVMHELGHAAVARAVGAAVMDVHVFFSPHVLCDLRNTDAAGVVLIGWGGCVLPFVLSLLLRPRTFWLWYAVFVLRSIAVFFCVMAGISTLLFMCGRPMPDDDMTQLLVLCPQSRWWCLWLAGLLSAVGVVVLVRDKPFDRCVAYFE